MGLTRRQKSRLQHRAVVAAWLPILALALDVKKRRNSRKVTKLGEVVAAHILRRMSEPGVVRRMFSAV